MYRYKRLLVALNLEAPDVAVVRYAALISRMAKSQRAYFVHVTSSLQIPEEIRQQYPEIVETPEDVAEAKMREIVGAHFDGHADCDLRYEVPDGPALPEILRRTRQHDIDMVVVGNAAEKHDAGAVPEKLARKAPCSVMIVHEKSEPKISRILVPLDFSDCSGNALEVAIAFAKASDNAVIRCLHAYQVPIGYHKIGKTYDEFAAIMKENAEKAYRTFVSRFTLEGINIDSTFLLEDRPSRAIEGFIRAERPDLVVMGARGRTGVAAVLLGSTTERLMRATNVPLLAVKKKGEGMRLLEALLTL